MECNYNNITFLTQIKWLYCEYILFNKYNFIKLFKKIYIFCIFKKRSCVPQIHVWGVTTMYVTPLRKGGNQFGLLPVCKGHCRCWLIRGVHGEYFLSY